jgi:hypothetical protein
MKSLKSLGAAIAVAGLSFVAVPAVISSASGGGGSTGLVAGECGTLTSVSASNVTLGSNGFASPLSVKTNFKNCSIYSQRYYVTLAEPDRPVSGGLNGPQVTCSASFTIFDQNIYSSGASGSISGSGSITPTAVTDPASCKGTHTLAVSLRNRTDAKVMSTMTVTYTVG